MTARQLRTLFEGRRRVKSGSFPLYRLCVAFGALSAVLQAAKGAPESVLTTTGPGFGWVFIALQLTGSLAILTALYLPTLDLDDSLRIEQIGTLLLLASCATYVSAVSVNNSGPPVTYATWLVVAIGLYLGYRALDIRGALRLLLHPKGGT